MIKRKLILFFLLLAVIPVYLSIQDSYADNTIKQIIKIEGVYPVNVASVDYTIEPELTDIDKAFVFLSFSHTGEDDHSDTFRSWELIDNSTLRIYGESTATGNNAEEFIAYIVEYEGDVSVQHSTRVTTASESEGEKSVTISAVNLTNSFVISKGHDHDADETTIGSEELDRIRLLTSTTWGWLVFDTPNSGNQNNLVDVVDWNQDDIFVQRGTVTMSSGSATATVSPPTDITKSRTVLLVTYACGTGCATTEASDDIMMRATLDASSPPDIDFTRVGTEDDMQISWELIEFPANFVEVHYDSVTMGDGSLFGTDTISDPVIDLDKSVAISSVGTPFGWGGGSASSTVDGAIDRGMVDIELTDNNIVNVERGDSTGTNIIEYMVIEFLEPVFSQNPQGTNTLDQIVKVEGTYSGSGFQDFTISPSLTNTDKTLVFMSINSSNSNAGSSFFTKNWQIIDGDTLRIWGTEDGTNQNADFIATIVEFDGSSPIFTQFDQLQLPQEMSDTTHTMAMSTVNTTNSFINSMGQSVVVAFGGDVDASIGDEEISRLTLTGATSWLHEHDNPQDVHSSTYRVMITDWNQNNVFVQSGTGSMAGTSTVITPSTAIDREDSILLVTYQTSAVSVNEQPNDSAISAQFDSSNHIVIQRNSAGSAIEYAWQVITFPEDFISVQHGNHTQSAGQENQTSTVTSVGNINNSFAIGTVSASLTGLNVGRGSSAVDSDFDAVTGKIELENPTTVRFTRGDDTGSWDLGYQVIEFTAGQEFNVTVTDTTTATENQDFIINKTAVDFSSVVDMETSMNITKVGSDLVSASDVVIPLAVFVVGINDTETTVDVVNLNITKQQSEIASVLENINFNTTKVFLDSAVVVDSTTLTRERGENATDTVSPFDNLDLDITKLVQDVTTATDDVVIIRLIDLNITDIVIVNDPSIQFIISSVVPTGTGSGGGSSSGTSGLPTLQRLVGLSITSELFHVKAGDVVPSDFIIETFGQENEKVSLVNIVPDDAFISWFQYSQFPDTVEFDTTIDSSRQISDPTRFRNKALDDFTLTIPTIQCKDLSVFDQPTPCIEEKIYEAPMIFTFEKGGLEFREKHIVTIDATKIIRCDYICEFVNFITINWWWLAGILIAFMTMYFAINAVKGKKVRVFTRVDRGYFTSFDTNKPRRKFKKGKR